MKEETEKILQAAVDLPPIERAELVEKLIASFDFPHHWKIDEFLPYKRGEENGRSGGS